jgi:hypothetical protein
MTLPPSVCCEPILSLKPLHTVVSSSLLRSVFMRSALSFIITKNTG